METESSSRGGGGFVSDKVAEVENDDGGGLGLKLQRTESYPYKALMTTHHHHHRCRSDSYDVVSSGAVQAFKSPGGGMGASVSVSCPFTVAQWQELERQALIFKHMMASIPVPPDLLLPMARNLSDMGGRGSSSLNLRFSNNTDPEPGRCRRTDGKKWRCSRDVAPDQKYCERHMHRGRPRSRKHVELQAQITNNNNSSSANNTTCNNSASPILVNPDFKVPSFEAMASSLPLRQPRGGMDLQHLVQMKLNSASTTANLVFQYQQEDLSLNSYTAAFSHEDHQQSNHGYLFLNNELASLEEDPQRPRQFIDAWSTNTRDNNNSTEANNKSSSISANGKLPLSNLTLSMSGSSNGGDQTQMGLCLNKSLPLSWMNTVPSIASPPGGPLGEVLQSSTTSANVGLNLMTDNWVGGGEAPTISSPSGVIQRTLASLSDSSGSSSPTFKRGDSMYL